MPAPRLILVTVAALATTIGLAGCGNQAQSGSRITLNGSGSSAQGAAQEAWIAGFQTDNSSVTVNYDPAGSGAGRKAFLSGGVQFAGSDSALSAEELAQTNPLCVAGSSFLDLPVYVSPIAIVFKLDGVNSLRLDAATLAHIFAGTITRWNDPAIVALNPGVELPSATITAVHRSDASGTTKNFTDWLAKNAPQAWPKPAADAFPYPIGEGAQGTSGVIDAVRKGSNTIGYADESKVGGLSVVSIKVGDGFVAPSADGAAKALAASTLISGRPDNDLAYVINRTTSAPGAYPLLLVSYLITCQHYVEVTVGKTVGAYARYLVSEAGQQLAAKAAGAAVLTGDIAMRARASAEQIK